MIPGFLLEGLAGHLLVYFPKENMKEKIKPGKNLVKWLNIKIWDNTMLVAC